MPIEPGYRPANDSGLCIKFDDACGVLRVALYVPLLPGYRPTFKHLAQYRTWGEWSRSPYFHDVTDEGVLDDLLWFWHDLEDKATSAIG